MIAYLELGYLTPLGGLRVCHTDLNIPWYSYTRVYEHTKRPHKYQYVQIILWYSYIHINRFDICVLMVSQIVYILAMDNKLNHSHLNTCYHLYKYAGFKW